MTDDLQDEVVAVPHAEQWVVWHLDLLGQVAGTTWMMVDYHCLLEPLGVTGHYPEDMYDAADVDGGAASLQKMAVAAACEQHHLMDEIWNEMTGDWHLVLCPHQILVYC